MRNAVRCTVLAVLSSALFAGTATSAHAQSGSPCWAIAYAAVRARAAAPHPPFIVYDTTGTIVEDRALVMRVRQTIAYRDDGIALVADDRFERPYTAATLDPGPPELGPYEGRRSSWLFLDDGDAAPHTIANVSAKHRVACRNTGVVRYAGRDAYDLVFQAPSKSEGGLQEMLVEARTNDIWKVVLRSYEDLSGRGDLASRTPVEYTIELERSGPYVVVRHVSESYDIKDAAQYSHFLVEYYYTNFQFPHQLPPSVFAN